LDSAVKEEEEGLETLTLLCGEQKQGKRLDQISVRWLPAFQGPGTDLIKSGEIRLDGRKVKAITASKRVT
jgi:hypothetical protein